MHIYHCHLGAILAEVNVVSDEPRLVRLDEVEQPLMAGFNSSSAPSRTSELSTYRIRSDMCVPRDVLNRAKHARRLTGRRLARSVVASVGGFTPIG